MFGQKRIVIALCVSHVLYYIVFSVQIWTGFFCRVQFLSARWSYELTISVSLKPCWRHRVIFLPCPGGTMEK